jgi:hypothetical protein
MNVHPLNSIAANFLAGGQGGGGHAKVPGGAGTKRTVGVLRRETRTPAGP